MITRFVRRVARLLWFFLFRLVMPGAIGVWLSGSVAHAQSQAAGEPPVFGQQMVQRERSAGILHTGFRSERA